MRRKIEALILAIISIFLFGFVISRYGPWWGLTQQASNPSSPSSGIKIFCDANNNLVILDPNGSTTELSSSGASGDITDIWDCSSGDCASLTVGNGEFLSFGSGSILSIPNNNGNVTADSVGEFFYDESDDQFVFYDSNTGELSSDEVAISPIKHISLIVDPGSWYDFNTTIFIMTIGDDSPSGIIIDEWKLSCNVDPDIEIDADLRYADAWIGLANAADIDELDTTNGVSTEDTDANINGGAAVANGKVIYIGFDADPEGTCTQMIFEIWYHAID